MNVPISKPSANQAWRASPTEFGSIYFLLVLAIVALLAMAFLYWAIPEGPVLLPDGVVYLGGAHNLALGQGYTFAIPPQPPAPILMFPPAYPIVLAAMERIAGESHRGALLTCLLLFGSGVWLAGIVVWSAAGRHCVAGWLASVLYAVNPVFLSLHGGINSESLFLPLSLLCIWFTSRSVETKRFGDLAGAGLVAGLSAATRYSGVVWVAAVPLTIFIGSRKEWREGIKQALVASVAAALPVLVVLGRNKLVGGSTSNREFSFHPMGGTHLNEGLITVSSWLLPWRFSIWVTGLLVGMGVAALLVVPAWRAWRLPETPGQERGFRLAVAVFSVLYVIHLPLAISFLHFNTPMDSRLLAPVELFVLGALTVLAARAGPRVWPVAAVLLLAAFYARQSLVLGRRNHIAGTGYWSSAWLALPALRAARTLPPEALLWSNKPEGIYAALDRPVRGLPAAFDAFTTKPLADAAAQLLAVKQQATSGSGYVVYFHPPKEDFQFEAGGHSAQLSRLHEFPLAELKSALDLREIVAGADASLFVIGKGP